MKHLIRFAIIAALISAPSVASAATAAELQAQAQALLQQVSALQAQLAQAQAAQGGYVATNSNINTNTVVSSAACPLIGRVLQYGSTGDDVTRLQKFLAQDYSIYPEAIISGYYGSLTEAAVKRWQVKYNIVSSGTAETTGYGVTGPRTAAAISLQCSTYGTTGGGGQAGPVGGFIQVTPVSGNAPLTVNVQATVNTTNSCGSATYTLNWGDGSAQQVLPVPAGVCTQVAQAYSHKYIYGGTYIVTLSAGGHQSTATVVVSGAGGPVVTPSNPIPVQATLSASATSGAAPLMVSFTTNSTGNLIDFGDGVSGIINGSVTHTYNSAGSYVAKILSGGTVVSNQITINVTTPIAELGPLAVTPNDGGNPLAVKVQFNTNSESCGGNATTLSWGDGTGISSTNGAIVCNGTTQTFSHIYSQTGSYTITLVRNTRTDTASLSISN